MKKGNCEIERYRCGKIGAMINCILNMSLIPLANQGSLVSSRLGQFGWDDATALADAMHKEMVEHDLKLLKKM
jgi:hypothetical protein